MHSPVKALGASVPTLARVATAMVLSVAVGLSVGLMDAGSIKHVILLVAAAVPALLVANVRPELLVYGGMALTSSDRFLSFVVSEVTLKPSHLLFTAALVGALLRPGTAVGASSDRKPASWLGETLVLKVFTALAVLIATQLLSIYFSDIVEPATILARVLVIVGGAVIPVAAIIVTINTTAKFRTAVAVFVLAQLIVACYGLYQLLAGYTGLPQGLSYVSGFASGTGRISALSSEPAFYAASLVSALPLTIYLALSRTRVASMSPLLIGAILFSTLLLANARAGYLGGLCALALALGMFALRGGLGPRRLVGLVVVAVGVVGVLFLVSELAGVSTGSGISDRFLSSFNATGDVSNTQRTALYRAGWEILLDHPVLGVGDGNVAAVLPSYDVFLFASRREGTILSTPLEIGAQSGILGLLALAGLYWQLGRLTFSRRLGIGAPDSDLVRALLLGAFVILTINGLFVVWLWDLRVWSLIGLAVAGLLAGHRASRETGWEERRWTAGPLKWGIPVRSWAE
jgi:O-antigen ligase